MSIKKEIATILRELEYTKSERDWYIERFTNLGKVANELGADSFESKIILGELNKISERKLKFDDLLMKLVACLDNLHDSLKVQQEFVQSLRNTKKSIEWAIGMHFIHSVDDAEKIIDEINNQIRLTLLDIGE